MLRVVSFTGEHILEVGWELLASESLACKKALKELPQSKIASWNCRVQPLIAFHCRHAWQTLTKVFLGVDSPFFSTIVLFKNQLFPLGFDGFLKRRIPGKHGEGSPRVIGIGNTINAPSGHFATWLVLFREDGP